MLIFPRQRSREQKALCLDCFVPGCPFPAQAMITRETMERQKRRSRQSVQDSGAKVNLDSR
jgi:NADH:ubiquinone oxidoreductase subunit B-like Fe-S oxidoreductase